MDSINLSNSFIMDDHDTSGLNLDDDFFDDTGDLGGSDPDDLGGIFDEDDDNDVGATRETESTKETPRDFLKSDDDDDDGENNKSKDDEKVSMGCKEGKSKQKKRRRSSGAAAGDNDRGDPPLAWHSGPADKPHRERMIGEM